MSSLNMFVLIFVLILLSSESLTAIDKPVITLAGIEDYRPYSYLVENRPEGLYNDILRELFTRAGYPLRIRLMPFKRILLSTKSGDVSGMVGTFFLPDRGKYATFLKEAPLAKIYQSLFVIKDGSVKSSDLAGLKGKLIAHKRGFVMSNELDLAAKDGVFKKYDVESIQQMIKMLLDKRIDVFCHTTNNALYYIDKIDKGKSIQLLKPPVTNGRESYIAFSKKVLPQLPANFLVDIQKAYNSMKNDGTITKLRMKSCLRNHGMDCIAKP